MELQEVTKSVSTSEDADNVILRVDSAVRPPSDLTATSLRPPSDSAASSVRSPPEDTAPVGFKGDPRSVRRSTYSQPKTSVPQPFKVATIFVDHFSRLSYVNLQESTKGVHTLAAKRSFEAYSAFHGVKVQQYHADNGRFAEHLFLNHCEKSGQKVSLCGVSAHFQNGISERRIKDLTESSRTSLLHAIHRWPSAVTINLWPYALRYINEVYNATPGLKTGKSPLEAFSKTAIRPKILDFHPPFCPVYVLHNGLQSGGSRPNKWVRRSRVAINLGQSPRQARSVALVLSLLTGYVSTQFHLKHDDFFETVRDVNAMPQSKRQELAKFTPEEITGKPLLPSAAKDYKRQVRLEPDHTPFNHDFTEDPIPVQGGHDEPQLPLQ
jgi:hypothetical protein